MPNPHIRVFNGLDKKGVKKNSTSEASMNFSKDIVYTGAASPQIMRRHLSQVVLNTATSMEMVPKMYNFKVSTV